MSHNTRVVAATVKIMELPLHTSFAISKGAIERAQNVLVTLQDDNGRVGIGEAAPFPVLTGDTVESAFAACKEMAENCKGKGCLEILRCANGVYREEFNRTPTARAALELAAWDLRAKQLSVSLASLWGFADLCEVETDITLPLLNVTQTEAFWQRFSSHQFSIVKVKVGSENPRTDFERIVELKKHAPHVRFTLDGNQGCSIEGAKELVRLLLEANVSPLFFEQPVHEHDWAGMTLLTRELPIPVCADETVKTKEDALRAVNEKAASMINLKFTKSGIQESLDIITIARAAKIPLMIGGMVETEIMMTASLHAVCGTGAIAWCDLDTPFFFSAHPCVTSPFHAGNAKLKLPSGPGLGLELLR